MDRRLEHSELLVLLLSGGLTLVYVDLCAGDVLLWPVAFEAGDSVLQPLLIVVRPDSTIHLALENGVHLSLSNALVLRLSGLHKERFEHFGVHLLHFGDMLDGQEQHFAICAGLDREFALEVVSVVFF